MLAGSRVVVVVPAFREEAHVAGVVATMPAFVDAIVLVDDGSSDRTRERALGGRRRARSTLERHPARRGVGAALTTGYRRALALTGAPDRRALRDGRRRADGPDRSRVASRFRSCAARADYVKGDRFGDPAVRRSMGLPRWIGGQVFTRLTSLAIGQRISDSQCGFTALARGAAAAARPRRALAQLRLPERSPRTARRPSAAASPRSRSGPSTATEISKLRLRHLPPIFWLIGRAAVRRRAARRVARTDDGARRGLARTARGVSS